MMPALCLKDTKTLFVAFDFDQCLDKIVAGDYTKALLPFALHLVKTHANNIQVDKVKFVTFSNRISDFYNDFVQPNKGQRPNIRALEVFAEAFRDVSNLQIYVDQEYTLDGDAFFAGQMGLSSSEYETEKLKNDRSFILSHKQMASTTHAKERMMEIITKNSNESDHFIFFDDKFNNLSTEHLQPIYKHRCDVIHFHASLIASGLNPETARKLKQPEIFAEFVIDNFLNVEDWFSKLF